MLMCKNLKNKIPMYLVAKNFKNVQTKNMKTT